MPKYWIYRTGGALVGPAHSRRAALQAIKALESTVQPGEPYCTLWVENDLGALRLVLVKTYYRPAAQRLGEQASGSQPEPERRS